MIGERDVVFQDGDQWNFWDENDEPYFYGPFETEEEARAAYVMYCRLYDGSDLL